MVQHATPRDGMEAESTTAARRARHTEILRQLRSHADEVDATSSEKLNSKSEWLKEHLERADANIRRFTASTPDAATASKVSVVDALLFHRLSVLSNRQARGCTSSLKCFTPASFVGALVAAIRRKTPAANGPSGTIRRQTPTANGLSFRNIPHAPYRNFRTAPALDFMLGVVDAASGADAKKRGRRPATVVAKGTDAVQPTEVKGGVEKASQMELHLANMRATLKRLKRCELWRFILDPSCFHRSCDNIWYLVNLIKDKDARLDVNAEPPVVYLRQPGEEVAGETPFFFDFNGDVYRMLIKRHNIRDCAIPPLENGSPLVRANGV